MSGARDIVITGFGVVSPIGIGREAVAASLAARASGVRRVTLFDPTGLAVTIGAEVPDFDGKQYVTPRKSLKVMSREIQLGFTAAQLAKEDAALDPAKVDPERFAVLFGADIIYSDIEELAPAYQACLTDGEYNHDLWGGHALAEMYPLWMLKSLPNMPACHVAIAFDARGPSNSITHGEASSLLAMIEAARVIERGKADLIIVGAAGSRLHPMTLLYHNDVRLSHRVNEPMRASRPFDADRDGMVEGEGAAAFILETREHAEARGAKIQARFLGGASAFEPRRGGPLKGVGVRASIMRALADAGVTPAEIGHVNAHGVSTIEQDRAEAQAIRDIMGDTPVIAPKSYFGNLGAAGGAVEMVVSLLAYESGRLPVTLNYETPDPECPVNVVHGSEAPLGRPLSLQLTHTSTGQAVAVVISAE